MLELTRRNVPGTEDVQRLSLPDDPVPEADAIVGVGHALNYLDDEASVQRALVALARSLRPGGVLALDLCDLAWGDARRDAPPRLWRHDDWLLVTEFSVPAPNLFVREITTFLKNEDGTWRRDDEKHDNVLIDTTTVPGLLAGHGISATVTGSFGSEELPVGLFAIVGSRAP
jgi:SAM-dependent methyltransferase